MPLASDKLMKSATKIEESPILHPKSRKCRAVVKKFKKDTKKEKSKQETKLKQSLIADKLLWFQKHLDSNICPYTIELTAELVEKYIARNDEELEQIKIKRSIGMNRNRQHIGREDAISMTKQRERGDYESCGLEIPNILNLSQCSMLQKWNGDIKLLPNFKFCHFNKRLLEEELKKHKRLICKDNNQVLSRHDNTSNNTRQNKNKSNAAIDSGINQESNIPKTQFDSSSVTETIENKMDVE